MACSHHFRTREKVSVTGKLFLPCKNPHNRYRRDLRVAGHSLTAGRDCLIVLLNHESSHIEMIREHDSASVYDN
jgi:hypothetical protein